MRVERLRADHRADPRNKDARLRMRTTAMYFVGVSALRAGNEKGKSEVKLLFTSLRNRHDLSSSISFLDSIRYCNKVIVDEQGIHDLQEQQGQMGCLIV